VAKPKTTAPKAFCFVLMPFSNDFNDVYKLGIKEACAAAGAYCERVDEQIFIDRILDRIYNQIAKADIIVADMTGRNPNVFYEVGYAHALDKLTILLTKNADDIPFDLKHFPHIVYGSSISSLRDILTQRVRHYVENPPSDGGQSKVDVELFINSQLLGTKDVAVKSNPDEFPYFRIVVHNTSSKTFEPGDLKLGLVTSPAFTEFRYPAVRTTVLPDGKCLHMLPDLPALFPTAYEQVGVGIDVPAGAEFNETVTVKLFTKTDTREHSIRILCGRSPE
jgi:hypothetical protein